MPSPKNNRKCITFLVPYPLGIAPGQRFRFEQYFDLLREHDFDVLVFPFLNERTNRILYKQDHLLQKIWGLTTSIVRRLLLLPKLVRMDFVFVYREIVLGGPPLLEWVISHLLRKKIIYDFDDAIWLTDNENESGLLKRFRNRGKVASICRWSYRISCGNSYLAEYAAYYNKFVVVNPTTIDMRVAAISAGLRKSSNEIVIGWTGSHTTLKYLKMIEPSLMLLEKALPQVRFLFIADETPLLQLQRVTFKKWSRRSEIADLKEIDIGLMPLPDDEWTRGKCGFKALQYMALEIPPVISDVGANKEILTNGREGYLIASDTEWFEKIERLVVDANLRKRMGTLAKERVVRYYSVESNSSNFLNLFG